MTGPEGAITLLALIASIGGVIVLLDWLARRKDRRSSPRS
jgi:hypothetical protein